MKLLNFQIFCMSLFSLLLSSSLAAKEGKSDGSAASSKYALTEWVALIPQEDLDALMNPPEYLSAIEDGSAEDQVSKPLQSAQPNPEADEQTRRYMAALSSTRFRPEFDKKAVRMPGFIVPLEFNEQNIVTTFFLVPFFGACIHQPPPPPNQIIYAEYEPGKKLDALYDAFWIEGTLHTRLVENDMATAAYTMIVDRISPYTEE